MSTVLPLPIPMMNEISKKSTGKIAETAASACTPTSRPKYTLAVVELSAWSTLLSISGPKKASNSCQIGRGSSSKCRRAAEACIALPVGCVGTRSLAIRRARQVRSPLVPNHSGSH